VTVRPDQPSRRHSQCGARVHASGVPVIATDVADNALILDETSGGGWSRSTTTLPWLIVCAACLPDNAARRSASSAARAAAVARHSLTLWASTIGTSTSRPTAANDYPRRPAKLASRPRSMLSTAISAQSNGDKAAMQILPMASDSPMAALLQPGSAQTPPQSGWSVAVALAKSRTRTGP